MGDRKLELVGAAIVLIGSFNPSIFHPSWFVRQELLPDEEVDSEETKLKVSHQQITSFETERFICQVTPDRFSASSKPSTHPVHLRDLVLGTFDVLEHTPVTGMGINRQMHFGLKNEEEWHLMGDRLAPKDGWRQVMATGEGARPGLLSMTILGALPDDPDVKTRVKVEPSTRVQYGVYFETNEHYPAQEEDGLLRLLKTLRTRFNDAQQHAEQTANKIIEWGLAS